MSKAKADFEEEPEQEEEEEEEEEEEDEEEDDEEEEEEEEDEEEEEEDDHPAKARKKDAKASAPSSSVAAKESMSWSDLGLSAPICEACESLGWKTPSQIQRESIPYALEGKDIIGLAETGSGKTGAFMLPVLHNLLKLPQRLHTLVMTPTRELAFQIGEQVDALGSSIGVQCCVIVGGIDMMPQAIALAKKPHVIVATPGRIVDHLENTKVRAHHQREA